MKRRLIIFALTSFPALFWCLTMLAADLPNMPMSWDPGDSIRHRWLNKPVLDSRPLDDMENLEFSYRQQGNKTGATDQVQFDFDQLELQRVQPDHFEGRDAPPGRPPVQIHIEGRDAPPGRPPVQIRIEGRDAPPGRPLIQTRPFRIGPDVGRSSIIKSANLYFTERCGDAVPGIHDICHRDWICTHGDQKFVINGGWHDAGDLSQGLVNRDGLPAGASVPGVLPERLFLHRSGSETDPARLPSQPRAGPGGGTGAALPVVAGAGDRLAGDGAVLRRLLQVHEPPHPALRMLPAGIYSLSESVSQPYA